MAIFLHDFTDAGNVFNNFAPYNDNWDKVSIMTEEEKEDTQILFASYTYENYSGSAFVLFRKLSDSKLYEVNGNHCSCHGLEGQWKPEEVDITSLKHRLMNGRLGVDWDDKNEFRDELLELLEKL